MPLELELIYRILNSFIMNDLVEGVRTLFTFCLLKTVIQTVSIPIILIVYNFTFE
jgi:hypothetical protein